MHGSAHGLGTYSASVHNPFLALGFVQKQAGSSKAAILVCGVVDDTSYVAQPQSFGHLLCHQESSNVRVVGDAVIALTSNRIAPFFVVDYVQKERQHVPVAAKRPNRPRPQLTWTQSVLLRKLDFFRCPWLMLLKRPQQLYFKPGELHRAKMEWASIKHRGSKWLKAHGYWQMGASKAF